MEWNSRQSHTATNFRERKSDSIKIHYNNNNCREENNENNANIINRDRCVQKARRKRQKALAHEMLHEYATNTTLHGLPYTTRKGVTLVEKIFWILTFVSSVCICSFLINEVWIKWQTSPVIVSISQSLIPVTEVPFPSVTICPQLKIKRSVYDYENQTSNLNNQMKNFFLGISSVLDVDFKGFTKLDDITHICEDWRVYNDIKPEMFSKTLILKFNKVSATYNIINVAPKKEDIFVLCKWHNLTADMNCSETLTEVITSEGLCYNVNSLAAHDILRENTNALYFNAKKEAINWTMEGGYSYTGPDVYPATGKAFGATPDLKIIFRDKLSEHGRGCNTINHGFNKVYIQHPADLPQSSLYYYPVRNGEVSTLALSFSMIETAPSVKKYPPEIRKCFFPGEFNLKYFKIYTSNNCLLECITNITYQVCGCIGFYMPHNTTTTCTFHDIKCMDYAREILVNQASQGKKACGCLPLCYTIDYQAENMKASFDFQNLLAQYNVRDDDNVSYSALQMFYKAPRFMSMYRSELFGRTDFFANIGGLLSLFLGFSFLSLVELFYYVTIRLCCLLKKDLEQDNIETENAGVTKLEKY